MITVMQSKLIWEKVAHKVHSNCFRGTSLWKQIICPIQLSQNCAIIYFTSALSIRNKDHGEYQHLIFYYTEILHASFSIVWNSKWVLLRTLSSLWAHYELCTLQHDSSWVRCTVEVYCSCLNIFCYCKEKVITRWLPVFSTRCSLRSNKDGHDTEMGSVLCAFSTTSVSLLHTGWIEHAGGRVHKTFSFHYLRLTVVWNSNFTDE